MKKILAVVILLVSAVLYGCGGGGGDIVSSNTVSGAATSFLAWTGSSDLTNEFRLVRVNGETGQITNIGGMEFFTALVYGPDETLYGVGAELHIINQANGNSSKVGSFTYAGSPVLMTSAAFSPNGTLYVVESASPNRIFIVNLTNAALTLVGTPSVLLRSIAFSPSGTMYSTFADFFVLSSTDASTIDTVGNTGTEISSMTFGADGALYGINIYPSTLLYKIDVSKGLAYSGTELASGNLVAIVAERSVAPSIKTANYQFTPAPHKSRAQLLAIESQFKSKSDAP